MSVKLFFGGILLAGFFTSCKNPSTNITTIQLKTIDNANADINPKNNAVTIITFLSPDCPLSENYTRTLNDIQDAFHANNIVFADIFPGQLYPIEKIQAFVHQYQLHQQAVLDPDLKLTKLLSASVTPETFVFNRNAEIVYSGAIDNWAVDLGEKRQVITEHYLLDAIEEALNGTAPDVKHVVAVGCFIEINGK